MVVNKKLRVSILLICSLILTSCGVSVTQLHKAEGFDANSIYAGGLGVGGFAQTKLMKFNLPLQMALKKNLPVLEQVITSATLKDSLGGKAYHVILHDYRTMDEINLLDQHKIAQHLHAKYWVFARLVENRVTHDHNISHDVKTHKIQNVRLESSRNVSIAFSIYDVQSAQVVFSGIFSDANENSRVLDYDDTASLFIDIAANETLYPAAPDLSNIIPDIINKFAKTLTGQ